jgi:ABC-type transporter Mla subunit MlaD
LAESVVILLDHARAQREQAEHARRLAAGAPAADITATLLSWAAELEQNATTLEERAHTLAETIAKTIALSAEVKALVGKAQENLAESRDRRKKRD